MSSALAIAGVSAVLRDLLNDGLINHDVSGVVGSTVSVTTLPPDRVVPASGTEATQLNLFLRQVTPNLGWRNEGLPSRDGSGRQRLGNPPLALNLHYLISAYGAAELHAEILLGYAMQLLHETPVLTRDAIRKALGPSPDVGAELPPALRALASSGLEDQVERLHITPEYLTSEEASKFWTATLTHFRPCAAYLVSVVLIQATQATRAPLPVLSRQGFVQPSLLPATPALDAVVPEGQQPVAQPGTTVQLLGHHLGGTARSVRLRSDRFDIEQTLPAPDTAPGEGDRLVEFLLPSTSVAALPVGVYRVAAVFSASDTGRETNQLALTLAPLLTALPPPIARDGSGTASFSVEFLPALRAGQRASLLLGQREISAEPVSAVSPTPVTSLEFVIPDAPTGDHLVRLRIDGIDSPIVDRSTTPPTFFDQRIQISDPPTT